MKHIIIDARMYGPKHTGIGRYTKNLLLHLVKTQAFKKYRFSLIVDKSQIKEIKSDLKDNYHLISTNIPIYSTQEQFHLPKILKKYQPDLVHFTHFNKPILFNKTSIVTVHDLIKHYYPSRGSSTKRGIIYWPKYLAYFIVSFFSIKTNHIIVPSHYWRQHLINKYSVNPSNIITTHEAVDPTFLKTKPKLNIKPQNYIIYTGNLYPHKNYLVIFKALKSLPDIKLKIICARSVFKTRAQKQAQDFGVSSQVEFLGYLKDEDFRAVYQKALALVHPSLMEGFSLTGLEAMSLNCPVISSNSSCLPEVYQDSVLYFDPNKTKQLVAQINKLKNSTKLRTDLIKRGHHQVKKYSWDKTAALTMNFYKLVLHDNA